RVPPRHVLGAAGAQGRQHILDEVRAVFGVNSQGVAGLVSDARAAQVQDDVPSVLGGPFAVEGGGADEAREEGVVAAPRGCRLSGFDGLLVVNADFLDGDDLRRRRRGADQLLERTGGVAASGGAAGEILLVAGGDRLGVSLTEVPARAAV